MDVITYPCWDLKLNHVNKKGPMSPHIVELDQMDEVA